MFYMARNSTLVLSLALTVAAGCATTGQPVTAGKVTTLSLARQDYLAGLTALREADYLRATQYLRKVARGPSYIVYTPLARLRLADALLFEERFQEAAEAYRAFTETAVGDPNLHYAYYRLAQATVKSLPSDFFLMPPADRRDQRAVRAAIRSLKGFLARFPDSPFVVESIQLLDDMVAIASSYEMEVAHFYMTRDRPKGAVNRIRHLMKDIPQTSSREETRLALAQALHAAGDQDGLTRECNEYRDRFPGSRMMGMLDEMCPEQEQGRTVVDD